VDAGPDAALSEICADLAGKEMTFQKGANTAAIY
jgi:hypothetical protein